MHHVLELCAHCSAFPVALKFFLNLDSERISSCVASYLPAASATCARSRSNLDEVPQLCDWPEPSVALADDATARPACRARAKDTKSPSGGFVAAHAGFSLPEPSIGGEGWLQTQLGRVFLRLSQIQQPRLEQTG